VTTTYKTFVNAFRIDDGAYAWDAPLQFQQKLGTLVPLERGLLPAEQEPGMVRVQIGRDQSLAATVIEALRPGQQVILLTGAQHASRDRGVPLHLARQAPAPSVHVLIFGEQGHDLAADELRAARFTPRPDPCEGLAENLRKGSRSG